MLRTISFKAMCSDVSRVGGWGWGVIGAGHFPLLPSRQVPPPSVHKTHQRHTRNRKQTKPARLWGPATSSLRRGGAKNAPPGHLLKNGQVRDIQTAFDTPDLCDLRTPPACVKWLVTSQEGQSVSNLASCTFSCLSLDQVNILRKFLNNSIAIAHANLNYPSLTYFCEP